MNDAIDVIVVPDFSGQQAHRFEARTLYFLASWAANAAAARRFPLHIAAIGNPPPSVARMAAELHALVTVHEPVRADKRGAANKLRGFEITPHCERGLLLDADVLVLGDLSELLTLEPAIAAAPAGKPRIPETLWLQIYKELGVVPPTDRIASISGELHCLPPKGLRRGTHYAELRRMPPYHNTGVVLFPWHCALRDTWESHIRRIAALFPADDQHHKAIACSDQAGFATATEHLRQHGVPFRRLPDAFHARPIHLAHGAIALSDIRLFHATGLCRRLPPGPDSIAREPRRYRRRLLKTFQVNRRPSEPDELELNHCAARDAADAISEILRDLHAKYVSRAMTERITG